MIEKNKDERGHKKRKHGKESNRRFLKRLSPPRWTEVKMADLEGSSRLLLDYNANESNVLSQGLVGLSHIVGINETNDHWTPLLPPPAPDRRHFGIMAVQESGLFVPGAGKLVNARWVFALEWSRDRPAWEALLLTLDQIESSAFTLPPECVVPAMFVAQMADQSEGSVFETVTAWGPVLEEAWKLLDPFLLALYQSWVDGPGQAAARYRQFVEYMPTHGAASRRLMAPFTSFIGPKILEAIRCGEHREATVMLQLLQASARLWTKGRLPFHEQELPTFLSSSHLHALLPLALWQSPSAVKQDLDSAQLRSLDDVLHLWKQYTGIG